MIREVGPNPRLFDPFDTVDQLPAEQPPRRSAPYNQEPGYYPAGGIWLYGNVKLLHGPLFHLEAARGPNIHRPAELDLVERDTEYNVLNRKTLVTGIHHTAHQRAAVVPLRWGAPRIVVVSGGFHHHLGDDLLQEPFAAARLWRYEWDAKTDLIISRRAPHKLPTYATNNPTVDRLIEGIATSTWPGLSSPFDSLTPCLPTRS